MTFKKRTFINLQALFYFLFLFPAEQKMYKTTYLKRQFCSDSSPTLLTQSNCHGTDPIFKFEKVLRALVMLITQHLASSVTMIPVHLVLFFHLRFKYWQNQNEYTYNFLFGKYNCEGKNNEVQNFDRMAKQSPTRESFSITLLAPE